MKPHFTSPLFWKERRVPLLQAAFALAVVLGVWFMSWNGGNIQEADLGRITMSDTPTHVFVLSNPSDRTLRITSITRSCDCVTLLASPDAIPAGSSIEVPIRLKPKNPGSLRVDLVVRTDGFLARDRTLRLTGQVAPVLQAWKTPAPAEKGARIDPLELRTLLGASAGPVLIDIRDAGRFAEGHLPDSLNVPLKLVRFQPSIHGRDVVLVDSGAAGKPVFGEMDAIKKAGAVSVRLLDGGIRSWQIAGGDVIGTQPSGSRLAELSPRQVLESQENWIVLDATTRGGKGYFPDDSLRKAPNEADAILRELGRIEKGRKVLLLTNGGENIQLVEQALRRDGLRPVYFVEGGLEAYKRQSQARPPVHGKMVSLPAADTVSASVATMPGPGGSSGGCSSCP
jgi:rhodanese-related sulfurtransferase